jgi:hypothetical protein
MPDDPENTVRRDIGGWISGPSLPEPLPDPVPLRAVPPGSSATRELLSAIAQTLTLPTPATVKDELTYLRISRDRARLVMLSCRRVLTDREADDRDIMITVTQLREQAGQLPPDDYDHNALNLLWRPSVPRFLARLKNMPGCLSLSGGGSLAAFGALPRVGDGGDRIGS